MPGIRRDEVTIKRYDENHWGLNVYSTRDEEDWKEIIVPVAKSMRLKHGKHIYHYDISKMIYFAKEPYIILEHARELKKIGFKNFKFDDSFILSLL